MLGFDALAQRAVGMDGEGSQPATTSLAGAAAAQATASGSLGTAIALAGMAQAVASAGGSLSTRIVLAGVASAVASAYGTLGGANRPTLIDISLVSTGHISVFDGSGSRVAIFGGTGARTIINGVSMKAPTLVNGRMICDRDPDEESYYGADITQELLDRNTTAASVVLVLSGVKQLADPQLQTSTIAGVSKTFAVAFLGNVTDGTLPQGSFWTARVRCVNGESFDKTTWFNRADT